MPPDFEVCLEEAKDLIAKLLQVDPNLDPTRYFLVPELFHFLYVSLLSCHF